MTSANQPVYNPVNWESYPRINTPAILGHLRINTPAYTHKHSRLYGYSPYLVRLSAAYLYLYLYIKPVVSCALMWTTYRLTHKQACRQRENHLTKTKKQEQKWPR